MCTPNPTSMFSFCKSVHSAHLVSVHLFLKVRSSCVALADAGEGGVSPQGRSVNSLTLRCVLTLAHLHTCTTLFLDQTILTDCSHTSHQSVSCPYSCSRNTKLLCNSLIGCTTTWSWSLTIGQITQAQRVALSYCTALIVQKYSIYYGVGHNGHD